MVRKRSGEQSQAKRQIDSNNYRHIRQTIKERENRRHTYKIGKNQKNVIGMYGKRSERNQT